MSESSKDYFKYLYEKQTKNNFEIFNYNVTYGIEHFSLKNKKILDIGCGAGWKTMYYAIFGGAKEVIGIDNYIGEGSEIENKERIFPNIKKLNIPNIKIIVDDFLTHEFPKEEFDVIFASSVLHHLYYSTKRASKSKNVFNEYLKIFEKIYSYLKLGGLFYLHECQKYSFSQIIPLWKNPIEWKTKQMASDWIKIMERTGFKNICLNYYVPYKLRRLKKLLNNWFANYLLKAVYVITAQK